MLQRRDRARAQANVKLREGVRRQLRDALAALLPGQSVYVFGSLTRPGRFNPRSDIDLALPVEPPAMSIFGLTAALEERLRRPVDVLLLPGCRFADKIRREGELWTS
jgi:predicted nucleotidyltransferase